MDNEVCRLEHLMGQEDVQSQYKVINKLLEKRPIDTLFSSLPVFSYNCEKIEALPVE